MFLAWRGRSARTHALLAFAGIALFVGAIVIGIAAVIARKLMPAEVEDADHAPVADTTDEVELELLSA